MIDLFGVTIHDPDVVFTDLGLSILGVGLGWRLRQKAPGGPLRTAGVVILCGLAAAALAGAIFHALFTSGTDTRAGFIAWAPVPLSILIVSATLLSLSLQLLLPRIPPLVSGILVAAYAVAFAGTVLLVDESFGMIVRFYAPALLLFLLASTIQAARLRSRGWALIAASFALSGVAAVLQQARIGIHPDYFDHNAVYHLLQGMALVLLFLGFRRVT